MAYIARADYVGNGTTTDFAFTFPVLDNAFVKATVDGITRTVVLPTAGVARLTPAPATGAKVSIFRQSGAPGTILVDYANGAALSGDSLDLGYQHALHRSEEAVDAASAILSAAVDAAVAAAGTVNRSVPVVTASDPGKVLGAISTGVYGWVDSGLSLKLSLAGGTMTGPLILAADPVASNGAATKSYADATQAAAQAASLPRSGGTLTGPLILSADASAALQATTKQQVDAAIPWEKLFDVVPGGTQDFTLPTTHRKFWFQFIDTFSTAGAVDLFMRADQGGGSLTGVSDYVVSGYYQDGATIQPINIGNLGYGPLTGGGILNSSVEGVNIDAFLIPGSAGRRAVMRVHGSYVTAAGNTGTNTYSIRVVPTTARIAAMRFGMVGQSFAATGRIIVHGLKV